MVYKQALILLLASIASILLASCSDNNTQNTIPEVTKKTNSLHIDELWAKTVEPLLLQPLWLPRDKYDTAHILMQPMQYAFEQKDNIKKLQFDEFFTNLESNFSQSISESRVATTQFMYFVSEYLWLKLQTNDFDNTSQLLHQKVSKWWLSFVSSPAWMWSREPFNTVPERLTWKLTTTSFDINYQGAIFDEELFLLATMSNLKAINRLRSIDESPEFAVYTKQMMPLLTKILTEQITYTDNSGIAEKQHWLFQKGVWSEHADYRYAGHLKLADDLPISPVSDIAIDSSHMHRWTLWLKSFAKAYDNDPNKPDFNRLSQGLAQQFNDFVYLSPTADFSKPRVTNYFDGYNGIYRYRYVTQMNSGYEPYQLSQILFVGWYANLASANSFKQDIEKMLETGLSFTQSEIDTYVGPNTSRERNSMYRLPDYFSNGLAELNIRVSLSLLEK